MSKAVMQQKPISSAYPNSAGTKAFENMAEALLLNKEASEVKRSGLARAVVSILKYGRKN